jgi:hypothetical protein
MPEIANTKQQYQNAEASQYEFATVFQENDPITAPASIAHWKL